MVQRRLLLGPTSASATHQGGGDNHSTGTAPTAVSSLSSSSSFSAPPGRRTAATLSLEEEEQLFLVQNSDYYYQQQQQQQLQQQQSHKQSQQQQSHKQSQQQSLFHNNNNNNHAKPDWTGQKTIKIPLLAAAPRGRTDAPSAPSRVLTSTTKVFSTTTATVTALSSPSHKEVPDDDDAAALAASSAAATAGYETIDYALLARGNGIRYPITSLPPLALTILLGCQHALTLLGGLVLIPLTIVPLMGGTPRQAAELIGTIYFVMGINTLIQSLWGNRLPIFQVTSFSYLPPTISIINNTHLRSIADPSQRFQETIQVISGSIMVAGMVQMALGYSGAVVPMLQYISPVTIASVTIAIGLGYYDVGFSKVATCFPMGLTMMFLAVICSQFFKPSSLLDEDDDEDDDEEEENDNDDMHNHAMDPLTGGGDGNNGRRRRRRVGGAGTQKKVKTIWSGLRFFLSLLPILMAMTFTGSLSAVLTAYDVFEEGSACRTDGARDLIDEMPFVRIPYPGQWHGFKFEIYGIVPMMGAVVASMIESVGHYYTCAHVSGAPPPTPGIISRGLGAEGMGVIMAGLFGTGSGVTSSSGNIGVIALTGVGSRAVVQMASLIMIFAVGMMGKVSAALAALPSAIVGGMFCVVLAVLVAVGLSNLQHVSLRTDRNLFIIGFSVFNCLSIAGPGGYFSTLDENPFGDTAVGRIALALLSSPMVIAVLISFTLDNTIPGTDEERGLKAWSRARNADIHNDPQYVRAYSLPPIWAKIFRNCGYLEWFHRGRMPDAPLHGWGGSRGDLGEIFWAPRHRRKRQHFGYTDMDDDDDMDSSDSDIGDEEDDDNLVVVADEANNGPRGNLY
ncbi:hypothetical protein ACA910_017627 [Epithemia clementina (nom. ined.)]